MVRWQSNRPLHPTMKVEQTEETNYFLKMEPFRERLLQHIAENPDFVQPEAFKNELKQMLSEPLEDLCISRPKARVTLGIELPFDTDFVTYVWFDALANYLTNINWPEAGYESWWAECEHLIGKDILKPHGVYWPIMLMAAGLLFMGVINFSFITNCLSVSNLWRAYIGLNFEFSL